jgi:hypothetical protein
VVGSVSVGVVGVVGVVGGGGATVVVGGAAVVAGGGCGGVVCFAPGEDGRGAEPFVCGAAADPPVDPLAAGGGTRTRGATVAGLTAFCDFGFGFCPPADGETTTFAAGGAVLREPMDGKCTVPESNSSAIAPAPSRTGTTAAATRRAIAQIPGPLSRSSADNGRSPLQIAPSSPSQGYKKAVRTATCLLGEPSLFPGNGYTA